VTNLKSVKLKVGSQAARIPACVETIKFTKTWAKHLRRN
jgi:hypothetical protein